MLVDSHTTKGDLKNPSQASGFDVLPFFILGVPHGIAKAHLQVPQVLLADLHLNMTALSSALEAS
jgi:hypothetical protein